ncbi:MAG: FAD-binding oxidoreductase [Proteobacteria bacterium]|nr:FAD-binding oxidoreductase [Pseudomonadota bacterium]
MKNKLSSWGKYPQVDNQMLEFANIAELKKIVAEKTPLIACGNGRSYGDSALAANIVDVKPHDLFVSFNEKLGLLHVQAGVMLADILEHFVPRGWFLQVVPGTKLITVGGAIASDVHGKNHHIAGCFSASIKEFRLMLANGEIKTVTNTQHPKHQALFRATCGGQGLTGIIMDAKIYLKKIQSSIIAQTTIRTDNLRETFATFEKYKNITYSVAWIDSMAQDENLGRCVLMVGDFIDKPVYGLLPYTHKPKLTVPFNLPRFSLNKYSIKAFNWMYYHKAKIGESQQQVDIDSFFFPLDAIDKWNNIYGRKGFVQYQFILPLENSYHGLQIILKKIAQYGQGSFLAVLKLHGKSNDNYLSFPLEGYSLALDFKVNDKVFVLLDELDEIVTQLGGRIYLAKDARISQELFAKGYLQINKFRDFRKQQGMNKIFNSAQSQRLGL